MSLDVIAAELERRADDLAPSPQAATPAPEPSAPAPQTATPAPQPSAPAPRPPEPAPEAAAEPETEPEAPRADIPWDDVVDRAIELLRAEPNRTWKPAELCRAVRDSGVPLDSLQGVHFGLMPRLRQRGAVREGAGSFKASELLAKDRELPVPPPSAPVPATAAPAIPEAKPKRELPWAELISTAARILHDDPDRAWGQAELVRAVRDAGVPLDNLQGIHFGLTGRLVGLGIADADNEGKLRLSSLVGGRDTAADRAATRDAEPQDEVDALAEEVDACEIVLERMPPEQRTAQVAVWAGRAREIQDRWKDAAPSDGRRGALRRVFGRLTRITRELHCEWIDALTPGWSMPWTIYIAHQTAQLAGEEAPLLDEEWQTLWRATLRGLLLPNRHVSPRDAAAVIAQASEWLAPEDDDLRAAKARFGDARRAVPPTVRRAPSAKPLEPAAEPNVTVSGPVLAATRAKRAVIVGGTGAREEHRVKLQKLLELEELEWVTVERGATGAFPRVEERIRHRTYDLVLFLAGYTSHKSVPVLKTCKAMQVPLVYLPRGYSAAQVVKAIEEQLVSGRSVATS